MRERQSSVAGGSENSFVCDIMPPNCIIIDTEKKFDVVTGQGVRHNFSHD